MLHVLTLRPLTGWGTLVVGRQQLCPAPHHIFLLNPEPALRKMGGQWLWHELGRWVPGLGGAWGWEQVGN